MARYVLTADTVLDGLLFRRGSIINASQTLPAVVANVATLAAVPRARRAGLEHPNPYYVAVPVADQIGRRQTDLSLPNQNTIVEPVLPTANKQYD